MRPRRAELVGLALLLFGRSVGCAEDAELSAGPDDAPSGNGGGAGDGTSESSGAGGASRFPGTELPLDRAGRSFDEDPPDRGGAQNAGGAGGADAGKAAGDAGAGGSGGSGAEACRFFYKEGHGDLFVAFEGGLALKLRSAFVTNEPETLEDPESVCVRVAEPSMALTESFGGAPEGDEYAFLGIQPGASFWLLPEVPRVGMPWFGASTEAVPRGRYVGDELRLALVEVRAPEGGSVAVWSTSEFGEPAPLYSTAEGTLVHRFSVGVHVHFNWSFSRAGEHRLGFRAEGTRAVDGALERSPLARFRFLVTP